EPAGALLAHSCRREGCLRCAFGEAWPSLRRTRGRAALCGTSLRAATATRASFSRRLLARRQEPRKNICGLRPLACFALQLLFPRARQLVIFCFSVVVGDAPLRADVAFLFELEERRIQGSVIHGQQVAAGLFDSPS